MARRVSEETVDRAYALTRERTAELCISVVREGHAALVVALPAGATSVGRDREATLRIGSPSLSRLHFAIELAGGGATLRDLGSRNGTLLNRAPITQEAVALAAGDEIVAGDVRFVLLQAETLPSSARPFWLLPELLRAIAANAPSQPPALCVFELEHPLDAQKEALEIVRQLPESARLCLVSDDTFVLSAPDPTLATWLARAFAQRTVAIKRQWVVPSQASADQLVSVLLEALAGSPAQQAVRGDTDVPEAFRYPTLLRVHAEARKVAPRTISVLILGETGTGKEVLAREIHRLSGRPGLLVAVNTAALPEALIESELFGHERGAFSGALTAKAGLIETADKGTLFLDEIGELPMPLQAKLLRVLEEQTVRRVGANSERRVDLRIVAATHQDLESLAREKRFRQDLLFRLNGVSLSLPPLRERPGEIALLARQLLLALGTRPPELLPAAQAALERYTWPGNVRELKHVLERALAFSEGQPIGVEHLPDVVRDGARLEPQPEKAGAAGDVRSTVKDFERERILEALRATGGNRTKAAELLGLPRRTLVYKLSKLNLADE